MAIKVVIYGLSTEGYSLACQIALNGGEVQIIDESTPSAISIKQDIAKTNLEDLASSQITMKSHQHRSTEMQILIDKCETGNC